MSPKRRRCACGCGKLARKSGKYHNWDHFVAHKGSESTKIASRLAEADRRRTEQIKAAMARRVKERQGQLLDALGGYRDGFDY